MAVVDANRGTSIKTTVPARLDRLPWARFHLMVVVALGITWILDGLEVTIVGALSGVLQSEHTLHLSSAQIGIVASCYVAGAVLGAIVFGWLTDRFGRRTMFYVTLVIYLGGVLLTSVSWGMAEDSPEWSGAAVLEINRRLQQELTADHGMVGESQPMRAVLDFTAAISARCSWMCRSLVMISHPCRAVSGIQT